LTSWNVLDTIISILRIVKEADTSSGSGNPNPSVSSRRRDFRRVPIEEEYTYCAFGNLIEGNDHDNPYGFTGEQQFREAAGLIFLRARYYDPSVGRFVSKDPILKPMIRGGGSFWLVPQLVRFPQLLHFYVYCFNNPINLSDPKGTMTVEGVGTAAAWAACMGCVGGTVLGCHLGCREMGCSPQDYRDCMKDCLKRMAVEYWHDVPAQDIESIHGKLCVASCLMVGIDLYDILTGKKGKMPPAPPWH
jgi:RHS repeat-associated protein